MASPTIHPPTLLTPHTGEHPTKTCSTCTEQKLCGEFYHDKRTQDGYGYQCKACMSAYHKVYRATHREQERARTNARYAVNKEHVHAYRKLHDEKPHQKERRKVYYTTHKARISTHEKMYRAAHKEEISARRKARYVLHKAQINAHAKTYYEKKKTQISAYGKIYRVTHKEQTQVYQKAYYDARKEYVLTRSRTHYEVHKAQINARQRTYYQTPQGKEKARRSSHKRRALLQDLPHEPYNFPAIVKAYKHTCHLCGTRFTKQNPPTVDHRIPLSKNGPDLSWNIAPACRSCNIRKRNYFVTPTQLPLFDHRPARAQRRNAREQ